MEAYNRMSILIFKHLRNELSRTEQQDLQAFITASEQNRLLFEQLTKPDTLVHELYAMYKFDKKAGWDKLMALHKAEGRRWKQIHISWRSLAVAAIIIVVCTVAGFWLTTRNKPAQPLYAQLHPIAFLTNAAQAELTLHNNTTVPLKNNIPETINDGHTAIQWNGNGKLVYQNTGTQSQSKAMYNTLATPAHQPLQVQLADRTQVQLDPSSAIHYNANTAGRERVVNLITGIAIFHVAPDSLKPFRVQVSDITMTAKGTRFTVSALPNENRVKAELEEGILEIRNRHYSILLRPGQQALVGNEGPITIMEIPKKIKPGSYRFYKDDFASTVRKLESWFGVKVVYAKAPTGAYTAHFNGTEPLSEILTAIGKSFHVKLVQENNRIIVISPR